MCLSPGQSALGSPDSKSSQPKRSLRREPGGWSGGDRPAVRGARMSRLRGDPYAQGGFVSTSAFASLNRLAQRQQWARSRPACVKFATTAPPLADIQPATLRHILQPHTGSAPPLAPAIRIAAQTSQRVSGAIARTVLSPSSKLRRQPRPHRLSNHAVPLAEMHTRRTASPCGSFRPHPGLARAEGSSLPESPFSNRTFLA
jgi:hypothetical protein